VELDVSSFYGNALPECTDPIYRVRGVGRGNMLATQDPPAFLS